MSESKVLLHVILFHSAVVAATVHPDSRLSIAHGFPEAEDEEEADDQHALDALIY